MCNQCMDKDCSVVHCEGRAEMINISQLKVCTRCNINNMSFEEKCAIQNDTQTLNLQGGINCIMINIHGETNNQI